MVNVSVYVDICGHTFATPPQKKNLKNSPLNSEKQTKIEAEQWVSFSQQK